jgi:hypothetical protein
MSIRRDELQVSLYVDRQMPSYWIVRDQAGDFWVVAPGDQSWEDRREPYTPSEDAQLESVPGHYKYLLGIAG